MAYKDHILLYSDKIHIFGSCSRQLGTTASMSMHVEIGLITLLVLECDKRVPTLEKPHFWLKFLYHSNKHLSVSQMVGNIVLV